MADAAYISVDVETSGPAPGRYSLLAIGACPVANPENGFYVELRPDRDGANEQALAVSGLELEELARRGIPADAAMARFAAWLAEAAAGSRPVFVAFNAAFDWLFVAEYFDRYVGRNPFGHSAVDIKSLYLGVQGPPWSRTRFRDVAAHYGIAAELPHHALEDARLQAAVFARILDDIGRR